MNFVECRICAALCLAVVVTVVLPPAMVGSQSAPPPPPPHDVFFIGGPGGPGGMMAGEFGDAKTVTGIPLSGIVTVSRETTLTDGNRIHNQTQTKVYRDSQGRVRREMGVELVTPATGNVKRNVVIIIDPVAGKRYLLNTDKKTVRIMPMHGQRGHGPEGRAYPGGPAGVAGAGAVKKEDLGTKTVNVVQGDGVQGDGVQADGVQADGMRVTRTIAAGAIGNDKPIDVVTERWFSPDLQIAVMTIHTDPMMGSVTTRLTNVTRREPDASLFQVPSDYTVETGRANDPQDVPNKP